MRARLRFTEGLQFVGFSETGHAVLMDGDPEAGGEDSAPRPMEMLLMSLGGCSGMDVASILRKKRQALSSLEVNLRGERAQEHPRRFLKIEVEFVVRGKDINEEAVARAVELSMKRYCAVKASLNAEVKASYKILPE
jgi:putative redox protein